MIVIAIACFLATAARAQTPQATPPPPGPPRPLKIPTPVEKTFANGMRVIVIQRSNTPLITAQVVIKNGSEVDPPKLAGLAYMTASLLTLGTKTRTAPQIAEQIDALGGSQTSDAQWDSSGASVEVMSDKIEPAMASLSDVIRNPTFSLEEIERLRQQYIDSFTVQLGEPGNIASFVGSRVVYGDSAYGHLVGGTIETLKAIKRADVVKLHETFYRPDNAILVIGGDISPADGFALGEKYFGDWVRPAAALSFTAPITNTLSQRRVVVIDKPDAGQAAVILVSPGLSRKDPDFFRGIVTNSVLDGYSGRLNQEIRIKRGLSYGAGSYLDARRGVGAFIASAQTRNDAGAQVADLLLKEVERLAAEAVTEKELVPRKAVLVGGFARQLEEVNGLVSDLSYLALMDLALDESTRFVNNVQVVTAADIRAFAAKRLATKASSIVIVGNAREFLPQLRKQFGKVEVIPMNRLDLNVATLTKRGSSRKKRY
ncbi:MAG TPA: pitrilysin family protein [Pyrinomonadaceae bacterium]|nr:pitrilysin family protein [Pyrinomonadaceae bacterium]